MSDKDSVELKLLDKNSITYAVTKLNKMWLDQPRKRKCSIFELNKLIQDAHSTISRAYIVLYKGRQGGVVLFDNVKHISRNLTVSIINDAPDIYPDTIRAVLKKASTFNLRKVITHVIISETDKISALEAAGFKTEVRRRQSHLSRGKFKTVLEMAMFLDDNNE